MRTKLEIITGFLGSGKSIFINEYIKTDLCKNKKMLVILLEDGLSKIHENENIKIKYLKTIEDLREHLISEKEYFEKNIIEFNGTMDLKELGEALNEKSIRKKYNFYGSIFVGECSTLYYYLMNLGELIIPFIQDSKIIVLNNMKLNKNENLTNMIESLNLNSPIVKSDYIGNLEEDLKNNRYFKEDKIIKIIKSKRELIYGKMG